MPRLTDEERERRRQRIQQEALEAVAARGQFNFRLEADAIKRLHALAGARKVPVSTMVRQWVLERLETEEAGKVTAPIWAQSLEDRLAHTEAFMLMALSSLGSSVAEEREAVRYKLREHVRQHFDVEADEELRSLLT